MRNTTRWVAAAALLLLAPACGDDSDDDAGGASETTAAGSEGGGGATDACAAADAGTAVTIADFAFDPDAVSVAGGGVVTLTNDDGATHTFTSDDAGFDCDIPGGETVNVVVDAAAGEYEFHCNIHPTMTGTITVE